jgi:hypothetical protein
MLTTSSFYDLQFYCFIQFHYSLWLYLHLLYLRRIYLLLCLQNSYIRQNLEIWSSIYLWVFYTILLFVL